MLKTVLFSHFASSEELKRTVYSHRSFATGSQLSVSAFHSQVNKSATCIVDYRFKKRKQQFVLHSSFDILTPFPIDWCWKRALCYLVSLHSRIHWGQEVAPIGLEQLYRIRNGKTTYSRYELLHMATENIWWSAFVYISSRGNQNNAFIPLHRVHKIWPHWHDLADTQVTDWCCYREDDKQPQYSMGWKHLEPVQLW